MVNMKNDVRKPFRRFFHLLISLVFLTTTLLGFFVPVSAASQELSSLSPGDTVNFAGHTWIILDPDAGYLLKSDDCGIMKYYSDISYNGFQPTDKRSIAYYLNNDFYNSLPLAGRALIQDHNWTTGYYDNESSRSVTCKIGLISYSEYCTYTNNCTNFDIIPIVTRAWWTRTQRVNQYTDIWTISSNSGELTTTECYYDKYCRPAVYLNPNVMVFNGTIEGFQINGMTMNMSGTGPAVNPAIGSEGDWTFKVLWDKEPAAGAGNYTMNSITIDMNGADTYEDVPVTAVSGPDVPEGGVSYGTLSYIDGAWTLTPDQIQAFRTLGTWVLQAVIPHTVDMSSTTVNITLKVLPHNLLSSLSSGETIQFAGYTWIVLDPDTGYLLMLDDYGERIQFHRPIGGNYDDGFVPTDEKNIAYYLNNDFYNSLPLVDRALIQDHSWTNGATINYGDESSSSVTCKVGLIGRSEYLEYTDNGTNFDNIPLQSYYWWTRTSWGSYNYAIAINPGGNTTLMHTPESNECHPAVYLDPNVMVVDGIIAGFQITGLTMNMSGNGPAAYTAAGSGADWTFTVPQDTVPATGAESYAMTSITVDLNGADTADTFPVTAVSGPGVPGGGTSYGTLSYAGGAWTLTPEQLQTFKTVGTWVLQAVVPHTADMSTTTLNITLNVTPTQPVDITGLTMNMSGSGPAAYTAAGSGADWAFTLPRDMVVAPGPPSYTMASITAAMTGVDTAETFPVTIVSGTGVPPGGLTIGALEYTDSVWTFTPPAEHTQTFQTAGTWIIQCTVKDTVGTPTTVSITLKVVSGAKDILAFTVAGQTGVSNIDAAGHTVTFCMPWGTDVTALTPDITVSPLADVSPASGIPVDFTNPVIYTVTADDKTTRDWYVTCKVIPGTTAITPGSGSYPLPQEITVDISADLTVSQAVYYTVNDGMPSVSDFVYSAPFQIWLPSGDTTVTAAVYDNSTGLWGDMDTVTYTAGMPTNTIAPIGNQNMTALTEGYASGSQETRSVTVTRTGTGYLTNLAAALSGANAGIFEITQPEAATLDDVNPSTTFTVKAKDGLTAGIYTATVAVTADNMFPVSFTVTITVYAPTVSASISPYMYNFDLDEPSNAVTEITWNSAQSVTEVVYGNGTLLDENYYTVDEDTLVIDGIFLSGLNMSEGDTADFEIFFDVGDNVMLTVQAVRNYTPGSDATLESLTVGGIAVTGFVADQHEYDVELPYGTFPGSTTAAVSAVPADPKAAVRITQAAVLPGDAVVTVTAEDTTTMQAYTIHFTLSNPQTHTYTLTVTAGNGGRITTGSSGSYAAGTVITLLAAPNSGYSFHQWNSTGGGTFGNADSADTIFTMPANTVEITAAFTYKGTGGGSSGSGGNSGTSLTSYYATVSQNGVTQHSLPVTINTVGVAAINTVTITENIFIQEGMTVINVPSVPNVEEYTLKIPASSLSGTQGEGRLTFSNKMGSITITGNMLEGTVGTGGKEAGITIGQGDKTGLPEAVQAAISDKPMVQLTLTMDGTPMEWNNLDAPVTVSIPYTPTAAELANPESIVIWYIDGSGKAVSVPNGHYDAATGTVTFTTTHFSDYAVVYNKVSFTDVSDTAWYSDAVGFIAARGITTGTGNGCYSPYARLTRGEFIVMLMRAYSIAPDKNSTDNFSDAGSTYHTGYLAATKLLGISNGVGNNMFVPDKEITRQEMFTLLYNALKVIGQLPGGNSGKALTDFTDAGQIDSWAKDAMSLLVETGTIVGSARKLNPASMTTRAETAQVLYNLLAK